MYLVLQAVRRYRDSEDGMRRRTRELMDMNETDLFALRAIVSAERTGNPLSSAELARHLEISSAATTKVVARLVAAGHIAQTEHPTDRRARLLTTLPFAHERMRSTLGGMHGMMRGLAEEFDLDERHTIARFLDGMRDILDQLPETPSDDR